MFSYLYNTILVNPLYNSLVGLMDVFPWMDAGIAVIILTIIVRLILFPLSKKAIVTQVRMKEIEPEMNRLREQYKNDRQTQAMKMMQLYKDKKISPFSSILVLLIQLPILLALYHIFLNSGLPVVNTSLLYTFVSVPVIDIHFLGLVDITQKSLILAIFAAVSQYIQLHYSLASVKMPDSQKGSNPQMDMAQNMTRNMKYFFPILIFVFAITLPAVVAVYWITTNLFTLGQELVVRKHLKNHQPL